MVIRVNTYQLAKVQLCFCAGKWLGLAVELVGI